MRKIIRTIYKVLVLMAGILILAVCLPMMWSYRLISDFGEWIKIELMKMDKTEKQLRELHDKLMSGEGNPDRRIYEKK